MMRRVWLARLVLASTVAVPLNEATGEPIPLGPPVQVNTGGGGRDPRIAADPAGNFMIVWEGRATA